MKLQFTNNYRPRFDQISRIMQFLHTNDGCKKVSLKDIIDALGIPDRQTKGLISMMTGFGLVTPRTTLLTQIGKAIIQFDAYFDKLETLWIIHYIVSSEPEWVIWHRIINKVLPFQDTFEADKVSIKYFSDLSTNYSQITISEKIPTEVGAVFAAYTRSELSRLRILDIEKTGKFIKTIPVDIPDLAFFFCLVYFRDKYLPGSTAMNIQDICVSENSPGRVMNLPEYQVRAILSRLHDAGLLRLEQLANLDQVRFSDSTSQESVLKQIYGGSDVN